MAVPAVKICGLCRAEDAAAAAAAGATYGGVILAPGGKRSQTAASAAGIFSGAPGLVRVGVFVDPAAGEAETLAAALGLGVVQLHGEEPPARVAQLASETGARVWKAVRPRDGEAFAAAVAAYGGVADGLLVDGWSPHAAGGTGARFPWAAVAAERGRVPGGVALVVAGGLMPENVAEAVSLLAPDVVDVSSGVEVAPCRKDADRVRAFVAAARSVDAGTAGGTGRERGQA